MRQINNLTQNGEDVELMQYAKRETVNKLSESIDDLQKPIKNIEITETDDIMSAVLTMDDGSTRASEVTFDENDRPTKIVIDGAEVSITWG